ncbi:MAG: RNA 2',3'-cyclic phosphodiesterase [Bryobacterales bacterium]|nr:RNA 2',3'-cyclic phosphodiesterase [Bryobacterales bacterium]
MRLFVGIDLPGRIEDNLSRLINQFRPLAAVRWSRAANLHITTKFIGEWPEQRLPELKDALGGAAELGSFRIWLRGLGWFPNPHTPRIFWVGVDAGPELTALAGTLEQITDKLGVPSEDRPFHPHLTLARLQGIRREELIALRQAVAAVDATDFDSFEALEFHLYESKMGPGGSIYTKLATYRTEAA